MLANSLYCCTLYWDNMGLLIRERREAVAPNGSAQKGADPQGICMVLGPLKNESKQKGVMGTRVNIPDSLLYWVHSSFLGEDVFRQWVQEGEVAVRVDRKLSLREFGEPVDEFQWLWPETAWDSFPREGKSKKCRLNTLTERINGFR